MRSYLSLNLRILNPGEMYMTKKGPSRKSIIPGSMGRPSSDELLDLIQKKLQNSAALNGGFDTLLHKIDKIEQSQGQIVARVEKIHEAIYDPADGIFSKMSQTKLDSTQQFNNIENKITSLTEWRKQSEKIDEKQVENVEQFSTKLMHISTDVDNLMKTKQHSVSGIKWLAVAIAGGLLTLMFTWIQTKLNIK